MGNKNIDFSVSSFSLKKYRQQTTLNNGVNSFGVDSTKSKIALAANLLTESSNKTNPIEITDAAQVKEDKLDKVLDLLEEITGKDITEKELASFIKGFESKQTLAPVAGAKSLRDKESILTQKDINSNKPGVDPGEENAFSNFKLDFYQSQKDGLENLLDEWKGVNSAQGKKEVANIKNQMKIIDKATNFWQGRADSWEEKMKEGGPKAGDDKFSTFKSDFYKSQLTGLENLMDEWLSVEDNSPKTNKQIAEIDKQIKLVEKADKFWTKENDFWAKENKAVYKTGDQAKVKKIYTQIEKIENDYDLALMEDSKKNNPDVLLKELNTLKGSLDKLKIKQDTKNDKPPLKTNFKEDASFADFKTDFYDSQKPGLKKLMDKFIKAGDTDGLAIIREELYLTDEAKRFWKDQNEFWTDLDKRKFSSGNEKELKTLTNRVVDLESLIDEASTTSDPTGAQDAKKANLVSELNSVKSEIYALQA